MTKKNSFLDTEITSQQDVKITDITTKTVQMKTKEQDKCIFSCQTDDGRDILISDVFVEDKEGSPRIQGLWWNGKITPGSAIFKVLNYYGKTTLRDLIGSKVQVAPDPNDFLILKACKLPDITNSSKEPEKANLFD